MVQNTQYRVFTAYSDESALEIGQIYQACNFYYIGKNSGASFNYINPFNTKKVMTDRAFRSRSFYKKYAKCLGIVWQKNWNNDQKILWENIPNDIEQQLRQYGKDLQAKSQKIEIGSKHKYAYVLGKDKKETKLLRRKFLELNKVYTPPKRNEIFK